MRVLRTLGRTLAVVAAVLVALVGCYVAYLLVTYERLPDDLAVAASSRGAEGREGADVVPTGRDLTVATYNIGFGAYLPDYTFFMDTGVMADGTATRGTSGTAESEESVVAATEADVAALSTLGTDGGAPDFVLVQECDTDSDRSHHVNQADMIEDAFPEMSGYYASNFHSAYLAWPPLDMHGASNSGLLTLTSYVPSDVRRRSYPVDESFPTRFFDLDRCFEVLRLPTDDGHELVLVNSHMSAYDSGGTIRARQLSCLLSFAEDEYAAGNYVVIGGDWNCALGGSIDMYESEQQVPDWVVDFDESCLPEGLSVVRAANIEDVPTCRGDDIPYERGVTYTVTVDGFVVSDNVRATARNVDTQFASSDHNPVVLTFSLAG